MTPVKGTPHKSYVPVARNAVIILVCEARLETRIKMCCKFFFLTVLLTFSASAGADDWPQWGGPQRDGVWRETGIVDKLPSVDPNTGKLPRM
jgi:hypothetical protein